MRTILIIGASSALGGVLIDRLKENQENIIVPTSRKLKPNIEQLDLKDDKQIYKLLKRIKPNLIIHLAAVFTDNFEEAFKVNVQSSQRILYEVKALKLDSRVLLIGSAAEYGAIGKNENPVQENHSLKPLSIYGLTKAFQSHLISYYASLGVDVLMARIFNLYGTGMPNRLFLGRLHEQIEELIAGRSSCIKVGALSAKRDYIKMEQAVSQIMAIIDHGIAGEVYHVASGFPISMREVLNQYVSIFKLSDVNIEENNEFSSHRGYDIPEIYADITKTLELVKKMEVTCKALN